MRMVCQTLAQFPCVLLLASLVQPAALPAQSQEYEGRPVLAIQFEPRNQPLDASELHDILPLKQDQPLRMDDVRERLIGQALDPVGNTPQQFAAMISEEIAKWGRVVKASGAGID